MEKQRFNIDYSPEFASVALFDNIEECVVVMDMEQVDALVEWYCKEFNRILV